MPSKSVYVSAESADTWTKVEALAQNRGEPMSAIVLRLLEEYLRREGQHQLVPPEIRQIEDGVIRTILELGRRTQDVAESIAILRKELIQAAACVHSWIEWVDERYPDLSQDRHSATIEVKVGLTDVDGDDEP